MGRRLTSAHTYMLNARSLGSNTSQDDSAALDARIQETRGNFAESQGIKPGMTAD
jgi:hypothetical protein